MKTILVSSHEHFFLVYDCILKWKLFWPATVTHTSSHRFGCFGFNNSSPLSLPIVSFSPTPPSDSEPPGFRWFVFFPNLTETSISYTSNKTKGRKLKKVSLERKQIYTKHHFWTSRLVFKGNKNISPLSLWLANMASSLSTNYKGVILGACPNRLIYLHAILVVGFDLSEKY